MTKLKESRFQGGGVPRSGNGVVSRTFRTWRLHPGGGGIAAATRVPRAGQEKTGEEGPALGNFAGRELAVWLLVFFLRQPSAGRVFGLALSEGGHEPLDPWFGSRFRDALVILVDPHVNLWGTWRRKS